MTSINDSLQDLMRARDQSDVDARNVLLASIVSRLIKNHLREPTASEHDVGRVLMIIGHLASKSVGAFGFGEPQAVGPTALGLLEHLAEPSEERQSAVVAALEQLLLLLRMASARTLACVGREALALLVSLSSSAPPPGRVRAFDEFAALSSTSGEPLTPVSLLIDSPQRLAWARVGLLRVCARLHASCAQFLGDGGPALWEAVITQLVPAALPPSLAAASASKRSRALRQAESAAPPVAASVGALRALLAADAVPPPMRSRLLYRLLTLLTAGLPAEAAAAAATVAAAAAAANGGAEVDAPMEDAEGAEARAAAPAFAVPPSLPSFRTAELDSAVGECLVALTRPAAPPLEALPLLSVALPHAFAASSSPSLLRALCALLCTLPTEALEAQLRPLEPLLPLARLRPTLMPCFERALAMRAPAPADEPSAASSGAGIGRGYADDGGGDDGDGGGEAQQQQRSPKKRRRNPPDGAMCLRARLLHSGRALEMSGREVRQDVCSLGYLGAVARLLAPRAPAAGAAAAAAAAAGAAAAGQDDGGFAELVEKLHFWLSSVVRMAQQAPERAGSQWRRSECEAAADDGDGADGASGASLLAVSLEASEGLLRRLAGASHSVPVPPSLVEVIDQLAALPWSPPKDKDAAAPPQQPRPAAALAPREWSVRFSPEGTALSHRTPAPVPSHSHSPPAPSPLIHRCASRRRCARALSVCSGCCRRELPPRGACAP